MEFRIGTHVYHVRVTLAKIFSDCGEELWAMADFVRKELLLSPELPTDQRGSNLRHEYYHAACRHFPMPDDEEGQAVLQTTIWESFDEQFHAQGGARALAELLPMDRGASIQSQLKGRSTSLERLHSDRKPCAGCSSDIMCGSITNGDLQFSESLRVQERLRWVECEACDGLNVWHEVCDDKGYPTGTLLQIPVPMFLRGEAKRTWLRDNVGTSRVMVVAE